MRSSANMSLISCNNRTSAVDAPPRLIATRPMESTSNIAATKSLSIRPWSGTARASRQPTPAPHPGLVRRTVDTLHQNARPESFPYYSCEISQRIFTVRRSVIRKPGPSMTGSQIHRQVLTTVFRPAENAQKPNNIRYLQQGLKSQQNQALTTVFGRAKIAQKANKIRYLGDLAQGGTPIVWQTSISDRSPLCSSPRSRRTLSGCLHPLISPRADETRDPEKALARSRVPRNISPDRVVCSSRPLISPFDVRGFLSAPNSSRQNERTSYKPIPSCSRAAGRRDGGTPSYRLRWFAVVGLHPVEQDAPRGGRKQP